MKKLIKQLFGPSVICATIVFCFWIEKFISIVNYFGNYRGKGITHFDYLYLLLSIPFIIIIILNVVWGLKDKK